MKTVRAKLERIEEENKILKYQVKDTHFERSVVSSEHMSSEKESYFKHKIRSLEQRNEKLKQKIVTQRSLSLSKPVSFLNQVTPAYDFDKHLQTGYLEIIS